jgi:hypothetical protein
MLLLIASFFLHNLKAQDKNDWDKLALTPPMG